MASILDLIPEYIRALGVYVPGKAIRQAQRESGQAVIKMPSNENPSGPTPMAGEAMRVAATEANFYPDTDAPGCRGPLPGRQNLSPEQFFVPAVSPPPRTLR